jgi:hypothetical protein
MAYLALFATGTAIVRSPALRFLRRTHRLLVPRKDAPENGLFTVELSCDALVVLTSAPFVCFIVVSIATASAHSAAVDAAITRSLWTLAFLMAGGIVLAALVW